MISSTVISLLYLLPGKNVMPVIHLSGAVIHSVNFKGIAMSSENSAGYFRATIFGSNSVTRKISVTMTAPFITGSNRRGIRGNCTDKERYHAIRINPVLKKIRAILMAETAISGFSRYCRTNLAARVFLRLIFLRSAGSVARNDTFAPLSKAEIKRNISAVIKTSATFAVNSE